MEFFKNFAIKSMDSLKYYALKPVFTHMDECENLIFLTSGGADSTALVHAAIHEWGYKPENCKRLFFHYSPNLQKREYEALSGERFKEEKPILKTLTFDIGLYRGTDEGYLPSRNLVMLSMATAFAEKVSLEEGKQYHIVTGILPDGDYPDTDPRTLGSFADSIYRTGVRLFCPWISLSAHKGDLLYYLRNEGYRPHVDFWSCAKPLGYKPCGECVNCKLIAEEFGGV